MAAYLADIVVIAHLLFVLFVLTGGFLLPRRPWLIWLHLPAVAWGAYIEFSAGICPLTPLENQLRALAGQQGYAGGFVEHYLLPILYPVNLTPSLQTLLGFVVVFVNAVAYWLAYRHRKERGANKG